MTDDDPSPSSGDPSPDPLPLRMLNEYAYCPRLFHFMHVEGRWEDNAFTAEGRLAHRRVDQLDHLLPDPDAAAAAADEPQLETGGKSRAVDITAAGGKSPADGKSAAPGKPTPGDEPPVILRSVPLSSAALGLSAKLDLVSSDGAESVPVETKRGRVPDNAQRSWEPERVQLMAQGLLLREQGYQCDHGVLYFAGSRTRVDVPFSAELESRTRQLLSEAHAAAGRTELPPPLEDSPKCAGCSLAGICLPDETLALRALVPACKDTVAGPDVSAPTGATARPGADKTPGMNLPSDAGLFAPLTNKPRSGPGEEDSAMIRRLYPARSDATPLYVQEQGAYVGKSGGSLVVKVEGKEVARASLKDVSQLVLCGNIQVSTQTIHMLCEAGVPVVYLSSGMWFYGVAQGITLRNAYDRAAQFAAAADPMRRLAFARRLVADKAENQRTMLRRNVSPGVELDRTLSEIDDLIAKAKEAESIESLLGLEGNVALRYFGKFSAMLKPRDFDAEWDFTSRNRRPPRDPVNAMLSFAYSMLAKECTVALLGEGLDPHWGFYHRPRHGRPAMSLDLMEPFRPVIADSAVISAINTGMVRASQFERAASGCAMNSAGRKALLRAYEARLDQLVTHPQFDYRCSWRSVIKLQARLLARWARGDVPVFANVVTR